MSGGLPDDVDPELWFPSPHERCGGGNDYLFDKHWLTHPGRMAAFCPHDPDWPDYRISLSDLPAELPVATRYWVKGFLAGNLPRPMPDCPEGGQEFRDWEQRARVFAETGEWPLEESEHPEVHAKD